MAILSDDEIRLRIAAETTGEKAVEGLARQIDNLAEQGGAAAPALGRLAGELRKTQSDADAFAASADKSSSSIGKFITSVKPVAASIAAAFGVHEVAQMAADFDSLNRSMNAITGSGTKAATEIGYITEASQRLGLDLQSTAKTYTSWLASVKGTALEGERGRAVFESVAGAMGKLGKSSADTEGAMMALGQMVSKGTVSMEELRGQLAERLPGAMQAAAEGAGLTVKQLTSMVETGSVLAEDLLPGMAAQLNKLYGTGDQAQGFAAGWNSLKSAATETVGRISQSEVVVRTVTATFATAREVILTLGTGLLTVSELFGLTAKSAGTLAAAFNTGEWSKAKDEIVGMASESAARINELAGKTLIAKGVQTAFGQATKESADAAAAGANRFLLLQSAYNEVGKAAQKYTDLQEKSAAAREAEGKAATELAQAFGTEAEQRVTATRVAEQNAEALAKLAAARDAEAKVAASQLAAVQAEADAQVAAGQKVSDAKQDEINKLREAAKAKDEEASKSAAAAESARVHAEATKLDAQAYADNSARVGELAQAWAVAKERADFLRDALASGLPVKAAAAAADEAAGKASRLYGDALSDLAGQIKARLSLQEANIAVESRGRSLQLEQIQTQIEVAKARGRDNEVAQLQNEYARVQIELSALKAKALRAEADAQLQLIAAKRAELEASGQMTEVKRLELAAAEQSAKAKKVDADIADELARRARELKDVVRGTGDSMDSASSSADRLADSWDKAAGAGDRLRGSADKLKNVGSGVGRGSSMGVNVGSLPDGLSTEQLRNMGFSSREIEDYQVKQKDAPIGTVNRQQFTTTTDNYALGIYKGLTSDQAKVFATRLSDEIIRANAEASGKAGAIGVAFGPKDYEALMAQAEKIAFEYAKNSTSAATVAGATQAVGGNFYPSSSQRTININLNGKTSAVRVADQASADAVVAVLQELSTRQ